MSKLVRRMPIALILDLAVAPATACTFGAVARDILQPQLERRRRARAARFIVGCRVAQRDAMLARALITET